MINTLSNILFILLPPLQMYLHRSYVEVFGRGWEYFEINSGNSDVEYFRNECDLDTFNCGRSQLSVFPRHFIVTGTGSKYSYGIFYLVGK